MRLLLGTHVFLWAMGNDTRRLSGTIARTLTDRSNDVLVSIVSLWKLTIKVRTGKLRANLDELAWSITAAGFRPLGVEASHLASLRGLPTHPDHRDLFDHLLIAQAVAEDATFVSADRHAARYPVALLPA